MVREKIKLFIIIVTAGLFLSGCARVYHQPPQVSIPGSYHEVQKGETLWRIAKGYGVDVNELIRINHVPDRRRITVGQLIFIPEAKKRLRLSEANFPIEKNFVWPIKGKITSYYGGLKDNVKNKGVDILVKEGAPIVASRSGKVIFCYEQVKGYGKTIIVDHGDGLSTVYAHSSENLVAVGEHVKQNTVIARAGSTGRTRQPIIHFQIRDKHEPRNPFHYLP